MKPSPLRYRPRDLVAAILGAVYTADTNEDDPYRWTDLVDEFTDDQHKAKTVDNVIRELVSYGALHKTGDIARGRDTRVIHPTPLGRAWLDRELLPLHNEQQDPDQ